MLNFNELQRPYENLSEEPKNYQDLPAYEFLITVTIRYTNKNIVDKCLQKKKQTNKEQKIFLSKLLICKFSYSFQEQSKPK